MYKPLIRQKLFFFLIDAVGILLSFTLAFYLRLGTFTRTDFPFSIYLENALLIIPVWLLLLAWGGRYALQEKKWGEILRVVSLSSLAGAMLFVLVFFFRREIFFSRLIVLYIFSGAILFGMLSFALEKGWERWKVRQGKDVRRLLVIGVNRAAREIIAALQKTQSRFVPVAVLTPFGGGKKELCGVPVFGKLDALERVVRSENIQEILVCEGPEQLLNLIAFAEGNFLGIRIAPEILGIFRENVAPGILGQKPVLTLQASPLFGWGQLWKRGFDMLLTTLLLPGALLFWMIKKIGHGFQSLFLSKEMIGAAGRRFQRYSFRRKSIFPNSPALINVLRGEMSFVGPAPAEPEEWEALPSHFRRRLTLRPGIFHASSQDQTSEDLLRKYEADLKYLQDWSFWKDLKILLRSFWRE